MSNCIATSIGDRGDQSCGQRDCISFNSSAFEDVDHEALWLASVKEVPQPAECAFLHTLAFLCTRSISLQIRRRRGCALNSTCGMS